MEANELRLGNLLFSSKGYGQILVLTGISNSKLKFKYYEGLGGCEVGTINHTGFDVKGITLTEEWLLRVGFENDHDGEYIHKGLGSGVYFKMDLDQPICGDFDECVHIKIPEYVHQLQNLYFDLTGKELEFKNG